MVARPRPRRRRRWSAAALAPVLVAAVLSGCSTTVPGSGSHVVAKPRPVPAKRFISTAAAGRLTSANTIVAAEQALQSFFAQYRLTLRISRPLARTDGDDQIFHRLAATDLHSLKRYGALFIDEWAKYPTDWVAASRLRTITLITSLMTTFGANDRNYTRIAASPDPFDQTMFYDVGFTGDYARETVHHEFGHLIEYNYFDSYDRPDRRWQAHNPRGFKYGSGGQTCYQPDTPCLTGDHPVPGFVSGYSTASIAEDKAELYAYLMTRVNYHHLLGWLKTDTNLARKVSYYEGFIHSHSPEITAAYFTAVNRR